MAIGTSLGAFFETEFDHHTGNELNMDAKDNNEWSPNEIMPHTPEPVDPSHYETALTPEQETKFQDWKGKMAPKDSGEDYDLRGAFLNNVTPNKDTGHWPDTFKKPNHPTFSDQSMYAGERPDLAGRWQGDVYIPPLPITPIANLTNTPDEIMSGLEGVRTYSGRGSNTTGMRRSANDNKDLAIKTPEQEAFINNMQNDWKAFANKYKRGADIIQQRDVLMNRLRDSGLNDLEAQKLKNLDKQHKEHFEGYRPD